MEEVITSALRLFCFVPNRASATLLTTTMLVDSQTTFFNDIFNADLFATDPFNSNDPFHSTSPNDPSSSRESSPHSPGLSFLLTPPQPSPPPVFPDLSPSSFFNFIDEDHTSKALDPMISIVSMPGGSYDFMSAFGAGAGIDPTMDMAVFDSMGRLAGNSADPIGIDPQLVGTPATSPEGDDEDPDQGDISTSHSPSHSGSPTSSGNKANDNPEKLTLLIPSVKVGGKGKARKGTIQTGGIVKKSPALVLVPQDKENINFTSPASSSVPTVPEYRLPASAFIPTNIYPVKQPGSANEKDDDDDLPHDWRPPPEVFQKMSSKEKRQLRNKISARNFRVRRKGGRHLFFCYQLLNSTPEYISTLEGDIAERDKLLDAIRSELGSTQSENYALRQEIATLKRVLLDGRGSVDSPALSSTPSDVLVGLNLPPPAPLPAQSAAETILAQAQAQPQAPTPTHAAVAVSTPPSLLIPNIHKDVSSSSHFWGGASMKGGMRLGLGGVTPVHRVVMPEMTGGVMEVLAQLNGAGGEKLQENMNPMLNQPRVQDANANVNVNAKAGGGGFDGYADGNVFTMKTMDAYRMHLWGKMATMRSQQERQHPQQQPQQQQYQQQQLAPQNSQQNLTGLASWMRPAYFSAPMLGGKLPAYPHPSPSSPPPPYQAIPPLPPVLFSKYGGAEKEREREKEREVAMAAALASQTLFKKLGGAFWDAFVAGGASSAVSPIASSSSSSLGGARLWDADKVRKVLEGKAVVRVVDVDDREGGGAREVGLGVELVRKDRVVCPEKGKEKETEKENCCLTRKACVDILEESMRSLSVGKKP